MTLRFGPPIAYQPLKGYLHGNPAVPITIGFQKMPTSPASPPKTVRLDLVCRCGAGFRGLATAEIAAGLRLYWKQEHTGPGHGYVVNASERKRSEERFLETD